MSGKARLAGAMLVATFCIPFARAETRQEPAAPTPSPAQAPGGALPAPPATAPLPSPTVAATPPPSAPPAAPLTPDQIRIRERMALVSLSTVIQAQRSYSALNNQLFDSLACLMQPATCIPNQADAAPVLDPGYKWTEPRLGYVLRFHPGPAAPAAQIQGKASPTSITAFAVTLTPEPIGNGRSFCGDSTGRMCMSLGGPAPVKDGRCEPCKKLQ